MGNQTILTRGMFQVGLAKLLAKTVEVKGIDSAWLCCAQKPTRIVRRVCKGERPHRPPGVKGGRKEGRKPRPLSV